MADAEGRPDKKGGKWNADMLPFDTREVVAKNVSGSTAGAGSGDFHVYRQLRREELFRIERLEKQTKHQEEEEAFERELRKRKEVEEEKTKKRAEKRRKKKDKQRAARRAKPEGDEPGKSGSVAATDAHADKPESKAAEAEAGAGGPSQGTEGTHDDSTKASTASQGANREEG